MELINLAKNAVFDRCDNILNGDGFKLIRSRSSYVRRTEFGFMSVSISGYDEADGGDTVLHVGLGVRHDNVDNIVNELGHVVGKFTSYTTTVFRGLEHFPFIHGRDSCYIIRN